ncbi:MAG: NADH-quinone oxidoreductase subunit L [Pseudomonadota bacterium]
MNLSVSFTGLLPLAPPALFLLAAVLVAARREQAVVWANALALLAALSTSVGFFIAGDRWEAHPLVSPAPASHLVAVLITLLGLVISSFSRNYLAGEPRARDYFVLLQLTLASVALVVLTDHMLLLFAAWVGISLGLHQLLLFYPERPRAALAAHKKFLFARLAELTLLLAVLILYSVHGSWQISDIVAAYSLPGASLGTAEHVAAALLAVTALIKCAQLPMHGWLIQVVEAPTPVSALLHAGIINLGGYLLILFSPLLNLAAPAAWLLLVIAGLTTVLASLIMTTRISIKVKLAWSTSAQMGLMLIECALGLYELALLHLLAHGCYKAYLFLNAGSAVEQHLERRLAPRPLARPLAWAIASLIVIPSVAVAAWLVAPDGPISPWLLLAAMLILGLTERTNAATGRLPAASLALALVLFIAYVSQKLAVAEAVPGTLPSISVAADLWVLGLITFMSTGWYFLRRNTSHRPLAKRLNAWLFAGLFLDEWVSRMTLRLWPLRLPVRMRPKRLAELGREAK